MEPRPPDFVRPSEECILGDIRWLRAGGQSGVSRGEGEPFLFFSPSLSLRRGASLAASLAAPLDASRCVLAVGAGQQTAPAAFTAAASVWCRASSGNGEDEQQQQRTGRQSLPADCQIRLKKTKKNQIHSGVRTTSRFKRREGGKPCVWYLEIKRDEQRSQTAAKMKRSCIVNLLCAF